MLLLPPQPLLGTTVLDMHGAAPNRDGWTDGGGVLDLPRSSAPCAPRPQRDRPSGRDVCPLLISPSFNMAWQKWTTIIKTSDVTHADFNIELNVYDVDSCRMDE